MESSTSAPIHLIPFTQSVINLLTIWPALRLSFEQSTTHQSITSQNAARSELAIELVGAFLDAQPQQVSESITNEPVTPSQEDIEEFLLSWTFGTLDVRIEDESEISISRDLISLWKEWSLMTRLEDEELVRNQGIVIQQIEQISLKQKIGNSKIIAEIVDEGKVSDDELSDNEDEDLMQIDKPTTQFNPPQRDNDPIVDQDGFTLVTKSKSSARR